MATKDYTAEVEITTLLWVLKLLDKYPVALVKIELEKYIRELNEQ